MLKTFTAAVTIFGALNARLLFAELPVKSAQPIIQAIAKAQPTESFTLTGAEERPIKSVGARLQPLRIKIVSPAGYDLPEDVRRLTIQGAQFEKAKGEVAQLTLSRTDRETVRLMLDADAVIWAEVERPNRMPVLHSPAPFNRDAARSHLVPQLIAEFPPGDGGGILAAVFDGGAIRATHQEFKSNGMSRITVKTMKPTNYHATHVAGTMAAVGVSPHERARGMAVELKLLSYDWDDDLSNLAAIAPTVHVTNHSYGPLAGWYQDDFGVWYWWGDRTLSNSEDAKFGKYSGDNSHLDAILHANPRLITVVAAGNDRQDGPLSQPVQHRVIAVDPETGELFWQISTQIRPRDGEQQDGCDTIGGLGLSKNALCIGAVNDIVAPGGAGISTTSFSSWGPADDGRIKPDVVANGFRLFSTDDADDSAYVDLSGTSMASPTAAGIACLLCQLFEKKHSDRPTSAELKAIVIHTAVDAGVAGPDPTYGWGSIHALRAGRIINSNGGRVVRGSSIEANSHKVMTFDADGSPVRATVVWTDPPASANTAGLDDATPTLQHNLDAVLIAPDGTKYFPYSLVRANPQSAATTTGPNVVDNVEVIDAPTLAGQWKLEVSAGPLAVGKEQPFAVVISGLTP